jgi:ribosomal-protein-alanine N-acetyltransferase
MSEVSFRLAREEDLDDIEMLEERCFPEEPWSRRMFEEELKNDMALFLVAEEQGLDGLGEHREELDRVVGYLIAWVIAPVESQVGSIAVLPEYRRHGLARQMLEMLLAACRETGTRDTYLEVRVSNEPAIALYKSMGFKNDGIRKRYYQNGEDAYTMVRRG